MIAALENKDIPELPENTTRYQAEFLRDKVTMQEQLKQADSVNTLFANLHILLENSEIAAQTPALQSLTNMITGAAEHGRSLAQEYAQGEYDLSGLDDLPAGSADFEQSFEVVIAAEGGYANIGADRGGETYMGIARKYHEDLWQEYGDEFRSGNPSEEALDAVKQRYINEYWNEIDGIENMNQAQAMVAFDTAVNHGTGYANKLIAETGGDVEQMLEARMDYYDQIIANDPSQKIFENGWNNRIANLSEEVRDLPAANDESFLQTAFQKARDFISGDPEPTAPEQQGPVRDIDGPGGPGGMA